jgi:hypothetical protein
MLRTILLAAGALLLAGTLLGGTSASLNQKQAAEQTPRIAVAGTAIWKLGKVQNNATSVHVQLNAEIAGKIGDDYIVLLTPRLTSYPFFVPYWKKAKDGFDITLVDPSLGQGSTAEYLFAVNRDYPVDWVVIKK